MRLRIAVLTIALLSASTAPARHFLSSEPHGKQCIAIGEIRTETAESDRAVIFHGNGASAYRNTLPQPCDNLLGINNLSKLKLSSASGDNLCAGDTIRVVDHDILAQITGRDDPADTTRCKLGMSEPISEMSVTEALRR
jgi:hypothetical protein